MLPMCRGAPMWYTAAIDFHN